MIEPYCFVDTAFFIRYLSRDIEPLATTAASFFAAIERGELTAQTSDTVVLETTFVMTKQYRVDRMSLAQELISLLSLDGLLLPRKLLVLEALSLWSTRRRLSYADSLHLVIAKHSGHKRIANHSTRGWIGRCPA